LQKELDPPDDLRGPKRLGIAIKFLIGAIFGGAVAFRLLAGANINEPRLFFGSLLFSMILVGSLSARLGIRFWEAVCDVYLWPWRRP
jgi:hypothetical protein